MAKYLSLDGLTQYDELIKNEITTLNAATLEAANSAAAGVQGNLNTHTNNSDIHVTAEQKTTWSAAAGKAHEHSNKTVLDDITSAKVSAWNAAEQNAKAYADGIKSDLLGGAGTAYDTLKELGDLINSHDTEVDNALAALEQVAASKVGTNSDASLKSLLVADKIEIDAGGTLIIDGGDVGQAIDTLNVNYNNLAAVAKSGSYNDLTNKPTIPTKVSELTNDIDFIKADSDASLTSLTASDYIFASNRIEIDAGGKLILNGASVEDMLNAKADKTTVSTLSGQVSKNTTDISTHAGYISTLQTAFGSITEITSAEISALFA